MTSLISKILFSLPPEVAHNLVKNACHCLPHKLLAPLLSVSSPALETQLGPIALKNPIGLAAGFDKNADMLGLARALGFGFVELGSVTALPCSGLKRPRIFRLPQDASLINRMGLPGIGAEAFAKKAAQIKNSKIPCGINIAKTPDFAYEEKKFRHGVEDFLFSYERLHHIGNYTTFNLSCPNTGEDKTFEDPEIFTLLAQEIKDARKSLNDKKPIFFKISPDLVYEDLKKVVETALKWDFDGFIVSNTTRKRPKLSSCPEEIKKIGSGGLSGLALLDLSTAQLKRVSQIVERKKILIGVGGIMDLNGALQKFMAGAQAVQVYTGLVYGGPFFVRNLNRDIVRWCRNHSICKTSAIGTQTIF